MESNLLPVGEKKQKKNVFLSQPLRRDCEAERAEFSTKDSATAERRYPGNALCCGGEERCKVG